MLQITIPKPCQENWDKMSPSTNGRHCSSCEKTVVDFTQMTDGQVQQYLINNRSQRVCGRFSHKQLERIHVELPQNIFQITLPLWKQFLVASLLVFSSTLFSCEANTTGEPVDTSTGIIAMEHLTNENKTLSIAGKDTMPAHTVGKSARCTTVKDSVIDHLMGDTIISPAPVIVGEPAVIPVTDTGFNEKLGEVVYKPVKTDSIKKTTEDPVIMGKLIAVPAKKN